MNRYRPLKKAFINSLPKSGTNLLAKCLNLFGYTERGHISAGTVLDSTVMARIRRITWRPGTENYLLGVNSPVRVSKSAVNNFLDRVKENQFITAHVGYEADLLDYAITTGYQPIQVVRDPRAVLASFVPYIMLAKHHFLHELFQTLSEDERYQVTLDGITHNKMTLRPLIDSCRALDPWLNNEKTYRIRFEDIVGDAGGGSDEERLKVITELADILDMPKSKIPKVTEELFGPGRHTFRKGKVDSWKEDVPEQILENISSELKDILTIWGYQQ